MPDKNLSNYFYGDKATQFTWLDTGKGVGLIERIKQSQGKLTRIYVKRFTTRAVPSLPPAPG